MCNLNELEIPADADDALEWAILCEYNMRWEAYRLYLVGPLRIAADSLTRAMKEFHKMFGTISLEEFEELPRLRVVE